MVIVKRIFMILVLTLIINMCFNVSRAEAVPEAGKDGKSQAEEIFAGMSTEQKVAQMIMPALRSWGKDEENVTDLSVLPELAEVLRRHQYGGVILFGSNIVDTEQTVRLIHDLQRNNVQSTDALDAGAIPYLIAADQEGGSVSRLTMGTRGTGSMAIGATGGEAGNNAYAIGRVFGEELSALGINVNLGPCIDVITDLADAGMSTRVYSDDPETVSELGLAFENGISESNVVTCFKHFPGAGDGSDYPTSIYITPDQLKAEGLMTFTAAIDSGAEMVMVSATTFPLIDEEILMADGLTKGYYPATLSPVIVTEMLRRECGFDGVVMTDALEMEQFVTEPDNGMAYFSGEPGSAAHDILAAEAAINAGCDILLLPTDLNGEEAADYYEEYIAGIVHLVRDGAISIERIDESVKRILTLKERHGILGMDVSGEDLNEKLETALQTVGSPKHHEVEKRTAVQAVTLLKNDHVLPLSGELDHLVIICRTSLDNNPVTYALQLLKKEGVIAQNTRIENHLSNENTGDEDARCTIVIDRYYDTADGGQLVYSDELTSAIQNADVVICLSAVGAGMDLLQDDSPVMAGVSRALSDAHASGSKFILLSDNLPVDAARFQEADAIVCAYLSAGFGIDPTARTSGSENIGAFNANVPAALCAIFGDGEMEGSLPITIPALEKDADGKWVYSDTILYERGYSFTSK